MREAGPSPQRERSSNRSDRSGERLPAGAGSSDWPRVAFPRVLAREPGHLLRFKTYVGSKRRAHQSPRWLTGLRIDSCSVKHVSDAYQDQDVLTDETGR